jgi:ankyrin repeat protein
MSRNSFPSRLFRSQIPCSAAVLFITFAWRIPAFCDEIHDAAKAGDSAKIETLIKENSKLVFSKNDFDMTPLHWAVLKGNKEVVELLLVNKADVNAKDNGGDTPLYYAAKYGRKEIMELLLANGSDVNAANKDGWTPLHIAASNGRKEIAELLLANKAEINAKNNKGLTPLRLTEIPEVKKVVVQCSDMGGITIFYDTKDVAELLRQHGGHE